MSRSYLVVEVVTYMYVTLNPILNVYFYWFENKMIDAARVDLQLDASTVLF